MSAPWRQELHLSHSSNTQHQAQRLQQWRHNMFILTWNKAEYISWFELTHSRVSYAWNDWMNKYSYFPDSSKVISSPVISSKTRCIKEFIIAALPALVHFYSLSCSVSTYYVPETTLSPGVTRWPRHAGLLPMRFQATPQGFLRAQYCPLWDRSSIASQ